VQIAPLAELNRVRSIGNPIPSKIATETQERTVVIQQHFNAIAPDLVGINGWRYQRQISPGIQEYMEALSFEHYLCHQKLITLEEAAATMPANVKLTVDDYVLGIFDLVGELMRFAITTMATSGSVPGSESAEDSTGNRDILMDLRSLRMCFHGLDTTSCRDRGLGRDAEKKMEVMNSCVEKVETAVYGMIIRGRERPKGWVPDLSDDRGAVEI
jgi:predicted translin family RNA/ssDNA-binding protein